MTPIISDQERFILMSIAKKIQLEKGILNSGKIFETYIYDNFFNPTKRDTTINNEGRFLPNTCEFKTRIEILQMLKKKGLIEISDKKVVLTILGIRLLNSDNIFDNDLLNIINLYQDRLASKFVKIYSNKIEPLNEKEIAAVIFLLYNNHTAKERGNIGTDSLAKVIDKITHSFAEGKLSTNTRSLNGRPGGGYFVNANRKLSYPIYMKHPFYYIKSSEIKRIKEIIQSSIHRLLLDSKRSFNPTEAYNAFEHTFESSINIFINNKALFATDESRQEVKRLIIGGEHYND
jgi:hypothetical protein